MLAVAQISRQSIFGRYWFQLCGNTSSKKKHMYTPYSISTKFLYTHTSLVKSCKSAAFSYQHSADSAGVDQRKRRHKHTLGTQRRTSTAFMWCLYRNPGEMKHGEKWMWDKAVDHKMDISADNTSIDRSH